MKKALSFILAVVMMISCFVGMTFTTSAAETEYSESITDNVGGTYHGNYTVNYADKGRMIYQTYVNYDFIAFDFGAYTNSTVAQPFTYSLYKWDTSIENTLAGEPVASQRFEDLVKGAATTRLEFDEPMPAGEYVFMVSNASGSVCVPFYTGVQNLNGTYYHKANLGVRDDAMPGLTVYTTNENYVKGTMFSKEPRVLEYSESITDNVGGTYHGNYTVNYADKGRMIYQTYVNYDFIAFDFGAYTNSTVAQPYTYSLYKWDTSIENTLAGEPVASQRFEDLVKGAATARLEFDEPMPAGEYVFMVSNASGSVCVPFYTGVQNLNGTYYHKANLGVRDDAMPGLTVYTTDESYVEGTMFSKEPPAPAETYVYVNSLDGAILYNETVDLAEVDEAMLAKLNAYANGTYNSFVKFEELSVEDGVHTFYSVHNTEAELTVNGGKATKANGYYILTADAPEEGQYFAGWYDGDILVSYNETCKFFPDEATESVTAKFAAEAPAKDSAVQVEYDRTDDKLTVKVTPMYGDNNVIVEYGYYIATSAYAMDAAAVIAADRALASHSPHVYMVRNHNILETTQDQNIYLVGFYTYVDGEGETQTLYTELVTVAPLILADESPDIDLGGKL